MSRYIQEAVKPEKESKEEKESHDSMKPLLSVTDPVNDLEEYKSIGMYDNLCMQGYLEIKEDNTPYSDDKVQKYVKDTDKNDIPFHEDRKLSIFINNKVSPECCTDSTYTTSSGCVCLSNNQKLDLYNRAGNK